MSKPLSNTALEGLLVAGILILILGVIFQNEWISLLGALLLICSIIIKLRKSKQQIKKPLADWADIRPCWIVLGVMVLGGLLSIFFLPFLMLVPLSISWYGWQGMKRKSMLLSVVFPWPPALLKGAEAEKWGRRIIILGAVMLVLWILNEYLFP